MSAPLSLPNAEEIAYWNASAGDRWAKFQDRIDRLFETLGSATLAAAAPHAGERVLDVGCGSGGTSLSLARAVGTSGSVVGVDVSRQMLALARKRATQSKCENVRFMDADAATQTLGDGAFDLVFSRFGVMFFDEPVRAFANLRKSVRSTGRLTFACWRPLAANPWFSVPAYAIRPHVPEQPKLDPEAPGPLAFADPDRVRNILESAGFDDCRFEQLDAALPLGSVESATEMLSQIGPGARLLDDADGVSKARGIEALRTALAANERDGQVALQGSVWIVRARPAA